MSDLAVMDARGFFKLPQAPEGAGYYTYGTPESGGGQYTHPALMSLICRVESAWQEQDPRKFGIGNISLPGGGEFKKHNGHKSGLDVDIRPLRKDGLNKPVTRFQQHYDRAATARLIQIFYGTGVTKVIFFNDLSVPHVLHCPRHDDHFHVTIHI